MYESWDSPSTPSVSMHAEKIDFEKGRRAFIPFVCIQGWNSPEAAQQIKKQTLLYVAEFYGFSIQRAHTLKQAWTGAEFDDPVSTLPSHFSDGIAD